MQQALENRLGPLLQVLVACRTVSQCPIGAAWSGCSGERDGFGMDSVPIEKRSGEGVVRRKVVPVSEPSRKQALRSSGRGRGKARLSVGQAGALDPSLPGMESERELAARERAVSTSAVKAGRNSANSRDRTLLFGTPREVLARISAGDPLNLRARVAAHLSEACLLIDADRLQVRALAHCARRALQLRASDSLEAFLRERVADAAEELMREDREALQSGRSSTGNLEELARPLGLDPARARVACARFNQADALDREACFQLLVVGADIDELARANQQSVTEIARRARRALETALAVLDPKGQRAIKATTNGPAGTRNNSSNMRSER